MDKRILVVDDEPSIRHSLERVLKAGGYGVELAEGGQDCLDRLAGRGGEFSLILLDVMMPGLSGWEVTARLMKDRLLRHIPIVYLSAKTDETSKLAGALGGEEYITKPFDNEDLIKKIRAVLARGGGGRKVLIVDDEAHTVRLVKRLLEPEGYGVYAAYSGDDALKIISEDDVDLILLDIMMPGLPPKEVIGRMRRMGKKAKIFYFSALKESHETSDRIERELISDGDRDYVVGFIEKPFDNQDLLAKVRSALQA